MKESSKPVYFIALVFLAMLTIVGISKLKAREIIPWRTDYRAAEGESRKTGKPLFLYFTATWCGPCQSLKSTTWADEKVNHALNAYIPTKIDVDENAALAKDFRIQAVPTMVILDRDGSTRLRSEGALAPEDFLNWLPH